jgi:hypothetical protein
MHHKSTRNAGTMDVDVETKKEGDELFKKRYERILKILHFLIWYVPIIPANVSD